MINVSDRRRVILGPSGEVVRNLDDRSQAIDLSPRSAWGGFEGAMNTGENGWLYVPRSDSSGEVDHLSRSTLLDRISHLYRNNGKPRRIIKCITRMVVGTGLSPEPMTRDTAYNDRVKMLWARDAESPKSFSLSGKFSSGGAQRAIKHAQLKTGDACMIAARDEDNRLKFALYDGAQIGNGTSPPVGMRDGVLLNQHDRATAYRILGRDTSGKPTQVDVDAQNVLFFAAHEGIGWQRGVTALAHAVNKLKSLDEIERALTMGIKMSSYQGWAIEQQLGTAATPGIPGAPGSGLGSGAPQIIIQDPKSGEPVVLEKFLRAGQIKELKPGQSMKVLHDERPHPNAMNHNTEQIRDIALGTDYPFEILWKIEALGGANTRFILADCQSKIEVDQEELCEQVLCPMYILKLQDWEAAGELQPCTDPEWWMHEWLAPARLTVDFGRDGRIYIEQWVRGHITLKNIYGYRGEGWKRQLTQWLTEIAWKKSEMERLGLVAADMPAVAASVNLTPDSIPPDASPSQHHEDFESDDF